jgi:hypothetical protein
MTRSTPKAVVTQVFELKLVTVPIQMVGWILLVAATHRVGCSDSDGCCDSDGWTETEGAFGVGFNEIDGAVDEADGDKDSDGSRDSEGWMETDGC